MPIKTQIMRMGARWPRFRVHDVDLAQHRARWVGTIEPQFVRYTLDLRYELGDSPQVRVVAPALIRLPGNSEGQLPHVYPPAEDPTLCLFDPDTDQWDWSMPLADTTVPWACDWIACYELWLITGIWRGGGRHAGDPIIGRDIA